MNPFDFVNAINTSKKDLIRESDCPDEMEKEYNAFLINRAMSYFNDTIMLANEMNQYADLDNICQFDFYINIVRPRKRFAKWSKKINDADLETIKEYYDYNDQLALQTLSILTKEQIEIIKVKIEKGG